MAQFFAHILPKPKADIGKITVTETHERSTSIQIGGSELHDLLTHFVCERTGLPKANIVRMELRPDLYGRDSLDQTLTVHFNQKLPAGETPSPHKD